MLDKTFLNENPQIDHEYFYEREDVPEKEIATGLYTVKYITYYSLNQNDIWMGVLFIFFIAFYYIFLFAVYLRALGYQNNVATPFSRYDYDVVPCTNYLNQKYWNLSESFESGNSSTISKRKPAKKEEGGILANLQKTNTKTISTGLEHKWT